MSNIISTDKVDFYIKEHKYVSKVSGKELISASTLVKKYSQPFDETGEILINKARKLGKTPEELQKEWDEIRDTSCVVGKMYHEEVEYWVKNKKLKKGGKFKDVVEQLKLIEFKGELEAERIVASESLGIAGCIDLTENLGGNVKKLWDHKTNRELRQNGFFKKGYGYQKMLYPLNHLMDSNLVHYALQMSVYAAIEEENGAWIEGMELLYVNPKTRKIERYVMPDMRNDVFNMIDHYYNRPIKPREAEKVEDEFGF